MSSPRNEIDGDFESTNRLGLLAPARSSARRGGRRRCRRRGRGRAGRPGVGRQRSAVHLQTAVPFRGERQAGIITEAQDRMHFATFDVTTDSRADLVDLLKEWTHMAERMTRGEETFKDGAVGLNPYAPPADTGEALGLPASQLTLTIGFGPSLFLKDGKDRFGIAAQRPEPSRTCRSSPTRPWTRRAAAATSAFRRAPTTRRSPCTRCATWPGSASAPPRCGIPNWVSAVRRRPPADSPRRETCSASRTEPTTSRPRKPTPSTSRCGWPAATGRTG